MGKHRILPVATHRSAHVLGSCMALALLAGCNKQPGGQVVAVVNNDDVTVQELNAEAQAAQLPAASVNDKQAVAALLQRVIDRNLLADYAKREGLDRGPDFVARKRQMEQALLADLAVRKLTGGSTNPSSAEVSAYIASNPLLFAERQKLALDQIRFPTPPQAEVLKVITAAPTLDGVIAQLDAKGIKYARGAASLDTGGIDAAAVRQILALKPAEAFALSTAGQTFVSVVTGKEPVSVDKAAWPTIATNALRNQRLSKLMADSLKQMRTSAKIEYDPAYKPAKK
jgi:peptidyl-prolyl cis-trans isomerase C